MSVESLLSSAIEAAVGIGGFAGIIAAVRQRGVHDWPVEQRLLLQMLLTASAATVLFSLAPWILAESEVPEAIGWRLCSGALLVWLTAIGVYRRRQFCSFTTSISLPRLMYVWVVGCQVLLAINLVLGEAWPFMLGVVTLLANGFTFFLSLLFWDSKQDDQAA